MRATVATVATAGAALACAALARSNWALASGPAPARPADTLLTLVASVGFVLALWLLLGLVLAALARLPGTLGRACALLAHRATPAAMRTAVAVLLGSSVAVAAAPVSALAAATGREPVATVSAARPMASVDDLPDPAVRASVPDPGFRPVPPPAPSVAATLGPLHAPPRAAGTAGDHYVVRSGDTLWDIAARHLGPRASAGTIAREWPRWYAANHTTIGSDPHHIEPGQRLLPPPSGTP